MARQPKVIFLLILATVATAFATDFDRIVKEGINRRTKSSCATCCPSGWVKYERRCYAYQASRMDWASAEKRCMSLGAHLISIHSENEYRLAKSLIRFHDSYENPTWIGLTSCQNRNYFFWSDGTKLTFTKWNPGEPNFHNNKEGCVHMNWESRARDRKDWNDCPCGDSFPFVCVKSIN